MVESTQYLPEGAVLLAPLSGYTDLPFRASARHHGCRYAFTEMVDAGALALARDKTLHYLQRAPDESWLGVQLIGSDPEQLSRAVEILNGYRFDELDFNLGCPAPKVLRKGEGAALGADRPRAIAAFKAIMAHAAMPVTAKIRILDERKPDLTIALAEALAEAGARAITVHGRVCRMIYSGPVAAHQIAAVRERLSIPVIANGGINDAVTAREFRERTGCSRIMVARGALGNPWIFAELADPDGYRPPGVDELADEIERYIQAMVAHYGEEHGLCLARKTVIDFLKGRGYPGELRAAASIINSPSRVKALLARVRNGPSPRYWQWLEANPGAPRRLRRE